MKKTVSPIALIVGGIVLVALLVFFFMRTFAPAPEPVTESPASTDNEAATKRANHLKAQGGDASAAPATGKHGTGD